VHAATYHLDSIGGDDSKAGTSPEVAWRSLEKVNATTFQPGDKLSLKAGATWTGQLHPKGSGSAMNWIAIDRYGEGLKPVIRGGGIARGPVLSVAGSPRLSADNRPTTYTHDANGNTVAEQTPVAP